MTKNHYRSLTRRFALTAAIFAALMFSGAYFIRLPRAAAAGNIAGKVFQDFNANGNFDTTTTITNDGVGSVGVAIDRGVAGVTVTAYNAVGASVGAAVTDAGGNYTLTTTDSGSNTYRLEFTTLPTGYQPSARNTDSLNGDASAATSGSTVQFAVSGSTNVNLAVNYPTDYSQNNPQVVASTYAAGDQIGGTNTGAGVLQSFPYSAGSNDQATGATEALFDAPATNPLNVIASQVGTTYGLAYARQSKLLYVGSFFKRHAGFGPGGPNQIYVVNRTGTGTVTTSFTVPGTATNSHNTADYNHDNNDTGWNAVGRTSLGGLAISEDETSLFVYNLANRALYKLNAGDGTQAAVQATLPTLPLTSGNCAPADVRPFALSVYHGQLYAGFVCSAQSSATVDTFTDSNGNGIHDSGDYFVDANGDGVRQATEPYFELTGNAQYDAGEAFVDNDGNGVYNLGDARQLRAYVYTVTVNQSTLAYGASPVFQMPLNYRRGLTTHTESANGAWRPWSSVYRNVSTGLTRTVYAQPMLTDIAFDNGNLILGLRDRVGDQVGNGTLSNPNDMNAADLYQPRTAGDVIRACGTIGSWTVENNGRCGGAGTAPQNVAEGPGGAEFYYGDAYDLSGDFISPATNIIGKGGNHDDTGSGGIEQFPGAPDVMMSNFDPVPNIANMTHDGGIRWLSNANGSFTKAFRLYNGNGNDTGVFGKAGGIGGNLTILSDPAPIELGNRVWRDANGNGVQDAGETGISGVTVHLFSSANTLLATAVTDAAGEYYFTSGIAADANITDNIGIVNGQIAPNTDYQIRFDRMADYNAGGILNGLFLTLRDSAFQAGTPDMSDSDAANVVNPFGSAATGTYPVISVTTGAAGANNHTLDVGFAAAATLYSLGNRVWFDTDNNGRFDASEQGISGVSVSVFVDANTDGAPDNAASPVQTTTTDASGYYRFDGLAAGSYVVRLNSGNFANGAVLAGYKNTTGADAAALDTNVLSSDNGVDPTGAAKLVQTNGILSRTITFSGTTAPTAEADLGPGGQGTVDNQANVTVDFGFYRLTLSGTIWNDNGAGANYNNGVFNTGETRASGLNVRLYDSGGTEVPVGPDGILGTADDAVGGVTTVNGDYSFGGLAAGSYSVKVNPGGLTSSAPTADPNNNVDSDDNGAVGTGVDAGRIVSGLITLAAGSTGALNNNTVTNASGTTVNPTLDFGLITSTAAAVNISGRVMTADGTGIAGVVVTLSNGSSRPRTATSNSFGYYRFTEIEAGSKLVLTASSKRYRFSPRIVAASEDLSDTDLVANP